ncbi:MAG TPA: hypothetical protein VGB58_09695, partial [Blastococcus sp.]
GSVLPAIALHAALNLFGIPLPAADGDWRPYLLFTAVQVVVATVLTASGALRRPEDDRRSPERSRDGVPA